MGYIKLFILLTFNFYILSVMVFRVLLIRSSDKSSIFIINFILFGYIQKNESCYIKLAISFATIIVLSKSVDLLL